PWMPDRTEANPNELNQDDARYGFRCCHLKNIWTAPLPPETELSRQMTTSTTSIDIMGLDRKSGSAGMPRQISYAVFCLKKKNNAGPQAAGQLYERARCWIPRPRGSTCGILSSGSY